MYIALVVSREYFLEGFVDVGFGDLSIRYRRKNRMDASPLFLEHCGIMYKGSIMLVAKLGH